MKNNLSLISGITLLSSTATLAGNLENLVTVKSLENIGINQEKVINLYRNTHNIELDLWEEIKVSPNEEGKSIKLETLDDFIINIDIDSAAGAWNKDLPVG